MDREDESGQERLKQCNAGVGAVPKKHKRLKQTKLDQDSTPNQVGDGQKRKRTRSKSKRKASNEPITNSSFSELDCGDLVSIGTFSMKAIDPDIEELMLIGTLFRSQLELLGENAGISSGPPNVRPDFASAELMISKSKLDDSVINKAINEVTRAKSTKVAIFFKRNLESDRATKKEKAIKEIMSNMRANLVNPKSEKKLTATAPITDDISDLDKLVEKLKLESKCKNAENLADAANNEFALVCQQFVERIENIPNGDEKFDNQLSHTLFQFGLEVSTFKQKMPIYAFRSDIIELVEANDVTIIVAETGSGKSTQLVKYLWSDNNNEGIIACTQPRKIAATSLSTYVSESLACKVGDLVGYDFGTKKKTGKDTKIVFKTDHSLIMEWAKDPSLSKYRYIIIDEAHERSLATDLLLSILKDSLTDKSRSFPLKIIITSATIDPTIFTQFFSAFKVKMLNVPGKIYNIDVIWGKKALDLTADYVSLAVNKVKEIMETDKDKGTILVFLVTPAETERAQTRLQKLVSDDVYEILQFHGKLPLEEQKKVFSVCKSKKRRIVFATNAAETSITVPNVTVVVDCGIAKEREYDGARNISTLKVLPINRSSARQRMGRAGRTREGKCYRLYTKEDHDKLFRESMIPEIKRVPLDQCILQILALGVKDLNNFDFVEPPQKSAIEKSVKSLEFLNAITEDENGALRMTELGSKMAQFAIDPRLSKILVQTVEDHLDFAWEALVLCAIVSCGGNVFFRQGSDEEKGHADVKKLQFCSEKSDFLTMLEVYCSWVSQENERDKSKWCVDNFINGKSMKTIRSTKNELEATLRQAFGLHHIPQKSEINPRAENYLHQVISKSFAENLAVFTGHPNNGYITLKNQETLHLHPSSSIFHLSGKIPKFVVFDQILTTSKSFMMHINSIPEDAALIESYSHLIESETISRHMISKVEVSPVGSLTMRKHFIGKKFCVKKEMEETLTRLLYISNEIGNNDSKFLCLEMIVDDGKIELYCHSSYTTLCEMMLRDKLSEATQEFREEVRKFELTHNTFSLLLGHGGVVVEPFLAFDFDTICIKEPFDALKIKNYVDRNIQDCQRHLFLEDGRYLMEFRTPSLARRVLQDLKYSQTHLDELGIESHQISGKQKKEQFDIKPNMTMQLQFERRGRSNFGFLEFGSEISAAEAFAELRGILPVKTCKNDLKSLRLVPIPPSLTEEQIRSKIDERRFGKVTIKLPLSPAFQTTETELKHLTDKLTNDLRTRFRIPEQMFTIKPLKNQPRFTKWKIFIDFTNIEAGTNLVRLLRHQDIHLTDGTIRTYPMESVQVFVNTRIVTYKDVFDNLKEPFETLIEKEVDYTVTEKRDKVVLNLKTSNLLLLSRIKLDLRELLEGESITHDNLVHFELPEHWERLNKASKKAGVIAKKRMVGRTMTITFFGKQGDITKAKTDLNRLLGEIIDQNTCVFSVKLSGSKAKRGSIRLLLNTYGYDLAALRNRQGLLEVQLIFEKLKTLYIKGIPEEVEKIKMEIESLLDGLDEVSSCQEEKLCSTCFTEPEKNDWYRFESCGHLTCLSCFKLQVNSEELPLRCPAEDCESKICIQDLRVLFEENKNGVEIQSKLLKKSLDHFISGNEKFHFCPTPDCGGIYPEFDDKEFGQKLVFHCLDCECDICTRCCTLYHAGYTCEISKLLEDSSMKDWLKEDSQNRRLCPGCQTGIEKDGGCLHVHCTKCNAHICWKCMGIFNNGVYEHIRAAHRDNY